MSDMKVTLDQTSSRYIISVDGVQAGFVQIEETEDSVAFTHTEVNREFEGKGVASRLAQDALTDAASRGKTIVPQCPYIARYLNRHEIPGAVIAPVDPLGDA